MNKIKDILYDKNDILVALLILAVAALIICSKVDTIMNYPEHLAQQNSSSITQAEGDTEAMLDEETQNTDDSDQQNTQKGNEKEGTTKTGETVTFVISSGASTQAIADNLMDEGLIKNSNDFVNYLVNAHLDTKIVAGTFKIPEGSSISEIADILTK